MNISYDPDNPVKGTDRLTLNGEELTLLLVALEVAINQQNLPNAMHESLIELYKKLRGRLGKIKEETAAKELVNAIERRRLISQSQTESEIRIRPPSDSTP